jgi:predicted DNA binding protein
MVCGQCPPYGTNYYMTAKKIEKLLDQALLHEGKMEQALYEHELKEVIDDLKLSMKKDKDDYIFTVTENCGDVAMLLVEKLGGVYINERARERLKTLWSVAYESNMKKLIPDFVQQLHKGELPINGVKVTRI